MVSDAAGGRLFNKPAILDLANGFCTRLKQCSAAMGLVSYAPSILEPA